MAIPLNDNIKTNAPKPTDSRYLNILVPYADTDEALSLIPVGVRYVGLTVNIAGVEYRWKNSTADIDLIEKTVEAGDAIIWNLNDDIPFSVLVPTAPTSPKRVILNGDTDLMNGDVFVVDGYDYSGYGKMITFVGDSKNQDNIGIIGTSIFFENNANFGNELFLAQDCNILTLGQIGNTSNGPMLSRFVDCNLIALDAPFGGLGIPAIDMVNSEEISMLLDNSNIINGLGVPFIKNSTDKGIVIYMKNGVSFGDDCVVSAAPDNGEIVFIIVDTGVSKIGEQTTYTGGIVMQYMSQAEWVGIDNTILQLPNSPKQVQKALEEMKALIDNVGGGAYTYNNVDDFETRYNANYTNISNTGRVQEIYLINGDGTYEFVFGGTTQYDLSLFKPINLYNQRCNIYCSTPRTKPIAGGRNLVIDNTMSQSLYRHTSGANTQIQCEDIVFKSSEGFQMFSLPTQGFSLKGDFTFAESAKIIEYYEYPPKMELEKGNIGSNTILGGFDTTARYAFNAIENYQAQVTTLRFINTAPVSGDFILSYDGVDTPALPYNISINDMQTALNTLFGVSGITVQDGPNHTFICTLGGVDFVNGENIIMDVTSTMKDIDNNDVTVEQSITATGKRQTNTFKIVNKPIDGTWTMGFDIRNSDEFQYDEPATSIEAFLRTTAYPTFPNITVEDWDSGYRITLIGLHAVDNVDHYLGSHLSNIVGTPTKFIVYTGPTAQVSKQQQDHLGEMVISGRTLNKNIINGVADIYSNYQVSSFDDIIRFMDTCAATIPYDSNLNGRIFKFYADRTAGATGEIYNTDNTGVTSLFTTLYPGEYCEILYSSSQSLGIMYIKMLPREVGGDPRTPGNEITPRQVGEQVTYLGSLYQAMDDQATGRGKIEVTYI